MLTTFRIIVKKFVIKYEIVSEKFQFSSWDVLAAPCVRCTDTLLRGCRLRRRICDPDDVIVGVVRTLTSRDTYSRLPRDQHSERSRRRRSDPSTRRNNRNSSSLARADSDESVAVSAPSPAFTDNVHDELVVAPAPVLVVDSLNTVPHFAMNRHMTSFDSNISNVADTETSREANSEDKENRVNCDVSSSKTQIKTKKKKRVRKKTKELNSSKTTETSTRDGDERRPAAAASQLVEQSLWELNGVKLWRFCAQLLGFGSKFHATHVETARATASSADLREPGRVVFVLLTWNIKQTCLPSTYMCIPVVVM